MTKPAWQLELEKDVVPAPVEETVEGGTPAWQQALTKEAESVPVEEAVTSPVDTSGAVDIADIKLGISQVESRGQKDPYKAVNKTSSARGKYQFLLNGSFGRGRSHPLSIEPFAKKLNPEKYSEGVSEQQYLDDPELQEAHMNAVIEKEYLKDAKRLLKKYPDSPLDLNKVIYLIHFKGQPAADKWMKGGKDTTSKDNVSIPDYLEKASERKPKSDKIETSFLEDLKAGLGGTAEAAPETAPAWQSAIQKKEVRKDGRGIQWATKTISDADLERVSKESGVPVERLKQWAIGMGGSTEAEVDPESGAPLLYEAITDTLKSTGGAVVDAATLGMAAKVYSKTLDDKEVSAFESVRDLVSGGKGVLQTGAEMAIPGMGLGRAAKAGQTLRALKISKGIKRAERLGDVEKVKKLSKIRSNVLAGKGILDQAAVGAAVGGVAGYGYSKEDEEVVSTLLGMGLGGAIQPALMGALYLGGLPGKAVGNYRRKVVREAEELLANEENIMDRLNKLKTNPTFKRKEELMEQGIVGSGQYLDDFNKWSQKTPAAAKEALAANVSGKDRAKFFNPKDSGYSLVKRAIADLSGTPEHKVTPAQIQDWMAFSQARQQAKNTMLLLKGKTDFLDELGPFFGTTKLKKDIRRKKYEVSDYTVKLKSKDKDYIRDTYRQVRDTQHISKLQAGSPKVERQLNKLFKFISDGNVVYQHLDNLHGLNLQPILNSASEAAYRFQNSSAKVGKLLKGNPAGLFKTKGGLEEAYKGWSKGDKELTKILDSKAYFNKVYPTLSNKEKVIVDDFREAFKWGVEEAKALGAGIDEREFYAPMKMVGGEEFLRISKKLYNEVKALDWRLLIQSKQGQALRKALEIQTGNIAKNKVQLEDALRSVQQGKFWQASNRSKAGALFQREDKIPAEFREMNPLALFRDWTQETFRHASIRKDIGKLTSAVPLLRERGDEVAANFVEANIQDILGTRKGTLNSFMKAGINNWKMKHVNSYLEAQEKGNKREMMVSQTLKVIPEVLDTLQSKVMYTNFLGLPRIDAPFRNLSQPLTLTAAEIGGPEAFGYYLKGIGAQFNAFRKAVVKGTHPAIEELKRKNLLAPEFEREHLQFIKEGITSNPGLKSKPQEVMDGLTEGLMRFYTASDTANRVTTLGMSKALASDFLKGNPNALKFATKVLGPGYRSKLRMARAALKEGSLSERAYQAEVGDLFNRFLQGKTQFHYDRISMSEFGRYMGPIFSVFTKWPTSVAGDIIEKLMQRDDKFRAVAGKYIMPWGGLFIANKMLFDMDKEGTLTDETAARFVGKKGLSKWAPGMSVWNMLDPRNDIMSPPVVQAGGKIIGGAYDNSVREVSRGVLDAAYLKLPFMGILGHFLNLREVVPDMGEEAFGKKIINTEGDK